ncbi:hypothetical protein PCASD_16333 [Puccinia coronata f. sp. avenae]|uniref:Uncharacterized protein n=1 Tax=Puccinia coronata f. sp. avenae TaxID=200324 RepID=A0A2N5TXP4_9BASI|nr:hypothetical protein PCASD_16333 [Puccinia coronata f. sp. avenae]
MEKFSIPTFPHVLSLAGGRPLRPDDPPGDYLDQINQHHGISVVPYDPHKDDVFYGETSPYEISGFYSDEEGDDIQPLPSPRCEKPKSVTRSDAPEDEGLSGLSNPQATHNNPSVVSLRATRKRSLTNLFHARPETLAPLNTVELSLPSSNSEAQLAALSSRSSLAADESGSPIIASRDGTPSPLEKLMLVDQNLDTLTGSSSRLDFFNPEEGSLCDNPEEKE